MDRSAGFSNDFVVFSAAWSASQAKDVLTKLTTDFVVIAAGSSYFLFTREEAIPLVLDPAGPTVTEIFDLASRDPTPAYPESEAANFAQGVVLGLDGLPTGVVHAVAGTEPDTRRGGDLGGVRSEENELLDMTGPEDSLEAWQVSADFPDQVEVESVSSLIVDLSSASSAPRDASLPVAARAGDTIDIVVQAQERFVVEGCSEGTITVGDDSLPVQIKLQALEAGPGKIRVLLFTDGVGVGAITLEPTVVAATDGADERVDIVRATADIAPTITAGRPDLNLLITEEQTRGGKAYSIRLNAADPALGLVFKEWRTDIRSDPRQFVAEMFGDIEQLRLSSSADRSDAIARVAAKGSSLFEQLLPEELRVELWSIRDRIGRVQINSEEPWIPWELVRLSGLGEDGRIEDGKFLCEYDATRWIPGDRPKTDLSLRKVGIIMPADSGLAKVDDERDMVLSLAGEGREVVEIPANFGDVGEALASGEYTALHFSGHGTFRDEDNPDRSRMMLDDDQSISPENLSGRARNLGEADPIVFLNACQIGRSGEALTDLGGWANRFIGAGAGAFIGALWNVHDGPAFDFASAFYTSLVEGNDLARAAGEARNAIRNHGDATWLAYTVYGYPGARLK